MKYGIDTRCQHLADDNKDEIYGAISYPIYQSATFARDRVGGGSGYEEWEDCTAGFRGET